MPFSMVGNRKGCRQTAVAGFPVSPTIFAFEDTEKSGHNEQGVGFGRADQKVFDLGDRRSAGARGEPPAPGLPEVPTAVGKEDAVAGRRDGQPTVLCRHDLADAPHAGARQLPPGHPPLSLRQIRLDRAIQIRSALLSDTESAPISTTYSGSNAQCLADLG